MGFAEQLAARAAETNSHNASSSSRRLTPPRPRPGKIIRPQSSSNYYSPPRPDTSSSQSNSSPSLFADQLKQRRARHENNSLLSDSNRLTSIIDDDTENDSTTKKHPSLVPSTSYIGDEDDEEDEYASVGFSLMDASTDLSVNEDENGTESQGERDKSMGGELSNSATATIRKSRRQKLRPVGTISDITASPPKGKSDAPPKLQQRQQKHTEDEARSTSRTIFPRQEQNDTELQTILQLQLMKSQSLESHEEDQNGAVKHSQSNTRTNTAEDISSTINQDNSSSKQIFGAWAQIEQLKRSQTSCKILSFHHASYPL